MRMLKPSSGLRLAGIALSWWGGLSYLIYLIAVFGYSRPLEMGITLGSLAILLLGLVTWSVADHLKKLEERLERIEKKVFAQEA